jgi:predicted HicB family RNase H-like nuclease
VVDPNREAETLRAAQHLFNQHPNWITFYREILGLSGVVRQNYPTPQDMADFEQTPAYFEIHEMLSRLRKQAVDPAAVGEETRVITVRIPQSLHDALKEEAYEHRTSMNKLCISKLLQIIDSSFVPSGASDQQSDASTRG